MDHARLLELVGEVVGLLDVDEFRHGMLRAVRQAVPADWVSLNDLGPEPDDAVVLIDPPFSARDHALFAQHALENPLVQRYMRTQDGRSHRFSDVATREELHATALYREFYAPIGLEHQIAFTLPHSPLRVLGLALSRAHTDFSDAERDLLDAARPFLIQCYRNAIAFTELRGAPRRLSLEDPRLAAMLAARGVTRRQAEVLSLAATGITDRAIAQRLRLAERTVQKHLQGCYARLGVHSRAEAIARCRNPL